MCLLISPNRKKSEGDKSGVINSFMAFSLFYSHFLNKSCEKETAQCVA
jgi:hypothetical protein